jgi:dTDP-glucose 4,6-dehydratase
VLITGGAGFIGSNLTKYLLKHTDYNIVIIDKLSYATKGIARIQDILDNPRVRLFTWDLSIPLSVGMKRVLGDIHIILNLAAESHVDNSIADAPEFIRNNVMSTTYLLEYAREIKNTLEFFFLFSTDEVFGYAPQNVDYTEDDKFTPRNPYSASKAACELICKSYSVTYDIPLISTNCMNVFARMQHVEKFIPLVMKKVLSNEIVYIHSYPDEQVAGSRFYIHADDVARAVFFLMQHGTIGESYNIRGLIEIDNLSLAKKIADFMSKELKYEMVNFHASRPSHDLRYSISDAKMTKLGWKLDSDFDEQLRDTVEWTMKNIEWLEE